MKNKVRQHLTIRESDIATIERLRGGRLPDELRDYLMAQYGKGGVHDRNMSAIINCSGSGLFKCSECCACAWDTGGSLLTQIALAVLCYEAGKLGVADGNHHRVLSEVGILWKTLNRKDALF